MPEEVRIELVRHMVRVEAQEAVGVHLPIVVMEQVRCMRCDQVEEPHVHSAVTVNISPHQTYNREIYTQELNKCLQIGLLHQEDSADSETSLQGCTLE